ncbi:MAG: PQQ-dependent sugar dehydrogenase [Alphaproteobacteria bacterium]|nr:PQQ-dependent sugar dehydrogenase [Alphaproteobacteria bacterium]
MFIALAGSALADVPPVSERPPPPPAPGDELKTGYKVTEVATGLDHPWSIAFLPDGSMLVTERAGRLRLIKDGKLLAEPITGVAPVHTKSGSQAGLFDVVLHPKYQENQILYLTYASGTAAANATRVARARFDGVVLQDFKVIFEAKPLKDTSNHFGARMAFLADGTFALTIGDGFEYREKAQDLGTHLGKTVRLNDDGSVPPDNPFVSKAGALPEIFSRGHRNEQGLAFDAQTGLLYQHEHGPQGGDELNIIRPGHNYGWPVITYGMDYSGGYVSPYKARRGMDQPILQWTPSIAPSGLAIYRGDKFPAWNGDAFVGALAFKYLARVDLDESGESVLGQQRLLTDLKVRIRDVRVSPDGYIYVTTDDAAGKVLKIEPAP